MKKFVLLLAMLLPVARASADDGQASSLATLAAESDVVAVGSCASAVSGWDDEHRFIVTTAQFHITRALKGVADDMITLRLLGGTVGNESMSASHASSLSPGETALLFLRRSQFGPYFVVWGAENGKLPVTIDPNTGTQRVGGSLSIDEFSRLLDVTTGMP